MSEKKKITKRRQRSRPGDLPQILKTAHGSAYMNYKGSRYFLGTYGSEDAEKERRRIVAEVDAGKSISPKRSEPITVSMLVVRFLDHAQKKYQKNGRSTGSYERFKLAVQPLLALYAALPVDEFRPLALRAVRQTMIDSGRLCRETLNKRITLICQIFRWGLGYELVPTEIRMAKLRANRKTKVQPSQICRKKAEPKRKPGKKYTPDSYRTSIQRAIERFNERLWI